ncbi:MAG: ABC transporter substrate-binding protein [Streptosporangiales bacterium]|nr:ABC transporter substrate-binding protein [Streptosporangiales bacterium]
MVGRVSRGRLAILAFATAVVTVAGCSGGGGSSGSGGEGAEAGSGNRAPAGTSAEGKAITDYLDYVGGKAGKADPNMSPITVGWVNSQGGQQEFPSATSAAQAAVDYVNAELGGIDGHPLQLRTCFIAQAEEEGQKCGQQLVNDEEVSVIAYGAVVTGNQSLAATVDGQKPIVVGVSAAPADSTAENTYILYGDQTHVLAPWGTYARDVAHAKTAAIVFPSQAGSNSAAAATKRGLEKAGVQVKSVGYDPQATDLLGPLTAAGGQTADVIIPMTDAPGCVNLAKALKQIGNTKPVVSNPLCLSPQVAEGLGDLPVGWVYGIAQVLPTDTAAPDTRVFASTATKYGVAKPDISNPYTALGWDEILIIAKLMNEIGGDKISPEAMGEQLAKFTGPLIMGAPTVQCGKYPDAPAVCNDQTKFYKYNGKGQFQAVSGWLRPPA